MKADFRDTVFHVLLNPPSKTFPTLLSLHCGRLPHQTARQPQGEFVFGWTSL